MSNITNVSEILQRTKGEWHDIEFTDLTLATVTKLVDKLYLTAKQNNLWWFPPSIGRDYDGTVSLDWWHNKKRYSIYVVENEVDYIAYWGNKTDKEREHGDINIENDLTEFWEWIAE